MSPSLPPSGFFLNPPFSPSLFLPFIPPSIFHFLSYIPSPVPPFNFLSQHLFHYIFLPPIFPGHSPCFSLPSPILLLIPYPSGRQEFADWPFQWATPNHGLSKQLDPGAFRLITHPFPANPIRYSPPFSLPHLYPPPSHPSPPLYPPPPLLCRPLTPLPYFPVHSNFYSISSRPLIWGKNWLADWEIT